MKIYDIREMTGKELQGEIEAALGGGTTVVSITGTRRDFRIEFSADLTTEQKTSMKDLLDAYHLVADAVS